VYIGPDCFALRLFIALVNDAGLSLAQAARFVREHYEKWVRGLERIEWRQLFPPPEPMLLAPTKPALEEGIIEFPPDAEIYFAIAKTRDGELRVACGTMLEIIKDTVVPLMTGQPPRAPNLICINLREVHEGTLKAAEQAGVNLGAPFTRPLALGEAEHRSWFAAVEVHRALSFARQKVRTPPGPPPAKGKPRLPVRAPARKRLVKA
jgi:hypothetical protein